MIIVLELSDIQLRIVGCSKEKMQNLIKLGWLKFNGEIQIENDQHVVKTKVDEIVMPIEQLRHSLCKAKPIQCNSKRKEVETRVSSIQVEGPEFMDKNIVISFAKGPKS